MNENIRNITYLILFVFVINASQVFAQSQDGSVVETGQIGFTKKESKLEKKRWKILEKLYEQHIKPSYEEWQADEFQNFIVNRNESRFCYGFNIFIERNELSDSILFRQLATYSHCNIEPLYFKFNIQLPKEFYKETYFCEKSIKYGNKKDIEFLESIVNKGDAAAGHAAIHLALMNSYESYPLIKELRNDKNVFTQLVSLRTSRYFGYYEDAKETAETMINKELECLQRDSVSCYGKYATWAAGDMLEVYPKYGLQKSKELYKAYVSFYSSNYFLPKYEGNECVSVEIEENKIPINVHKKVQSFQWADQLIEEKIERIVKKYPHWINNKEVQFITEYAVKRRLPKH